MLSLSPHTETQVASQHACQIEQPQSEEGTQIAYAHMALNAIDATIHHVSLAIFFEYANGTTISMEFEIRPYDERYLRAMVADVYPLNGSVCSRFKITHYMQRDARGELQRNIEVLNQRDPEQKYARCMVIDFKDKAKEYGCRRDIQTAEDQFANFFGEEPPEWETQTSIYNLVKQNRIEFVINEGRLKADLISRVFNDQQRHYLQRDAEGAKLLCLFCEVIMNGFKLGCETIQNDHHFLPAEYINRISGEREYNDVEDRQPRLMTLYSPHYKDKYSRESEYYTLIEQNFNSRHECDASDTTIITIE